MFIIRRMFYIINVANSQLQLSLELRNCFPSVRPSDVTNLGQFLSDHFHIAYGQYRHCDCFYRQKKLGTGRGQLGVNWGSPGGRPKWISSNMIVGKYSWCGFWISNLFGPILIFGPEEFLFVFGPEEGVKWGSSKMSV